MKWCRKNLPSPACGRGAGGEGIQHSACDPKARTLTLAQREKEPLPWCAMKWLTAALSLLTLSAALAEAKETAPILREIGFDQHLNEQIPLNLEFTDESGKTVKLSDYFGKKPVVLVLAYYKCPMLCTLVLNDLVQSMHSIPFDVGREFEVLTISFDPRETKELAVKKKANYVKAYGRPGAAEGWHFLGKSASIDPLTKAVGFRYVWDKKTEQFIHPSGIMILTPGGKISRYFFAMPFKPRDLRFGLIEASENKIGSRTDAIVLSCFDYDPAMGKYSANILKLVRIGGIATVIGIIAMVWFLGRRRRHVSVPLPDAAKQGGPA
jgi:protein SCO1